MREFLELLHGPPSDDLTEIRCIGHGGRVVQRWFRDREEAFAFATDMSAEGMDAYFGVLPRLRPEGTGDAVTPETSVLWADLDASDHLGGWWSVTGKARCLAVLSTFDVTPTVIVDSGHGYHAYWCLSAPAPWEWARLAMLGIAERLRGDRVYDAARILRVPGTTNHKDPGAPLPVRIIRYDPTRVMRLADHEHSLSVGLWHQWQEESPIPRRVSHEGVPAGVFTGDGALRTLIAQGAPQGTRSERCFGVMCELMRQGYTDEQVADVFRDPMNGIGDKYREKRSGGEAWLTRSIRKARAEVSLTHPLRGGSRS